MLRRFLSTAVRATLPKTSSVIGSRIAPTFSPLARFSTEIRRVTKDAPAEENEEEDALPPLETYDPDASCSMKNIKQDGSTRRFYRHVSITPEADGKYALRLAGNIAITPHGFHLILPNKAYAMMVALEFQNQKTFIYPHTMPLTNLALTVIDRVPFERESMTQNCMGILKYDSTCYREDREDAPGLARLQEKHFDPLLKWMKTEFNAPLNHTYDLCAVEQPPQTFTTVEAIIRSMDDYTFAAFEDLTLVGKSVVISLAFIKHRLSIDQAFRAIRLEENFQVKGSGRVEGVYGTVIPEEYAKLKLAAARTGLNLLNYQLH